MDEAAAAEHAETEPTRWGDRERRREDILTAARSLIEGDGYLSMNMRDLASGAGVSPATLYSYFATKEHLFVTLYTEAVRDHERDIHHLREADIGLVELFGILIRRQMETWQRYGRHFTSWSALRSDVDADEAPFPRELIVDLRRAALDQGRTVWAAVRRAAERDGVDVVEPPLGPALLWSVFNGLAEHLSSERRFLDEFEPDEFLDFAAERLAIAMTDPR